MLKAAAGSTLRLQLAVAQAASAIQFALLFAVVLVIVKLTREYAPPGGLYVVATIAGLTDVDAITLGPDGL